VSKEEIKYEINKVLDNLPDKALEELLVFLKELDLKINSEKIFKNPFKQILDEDSELLARLAQ